MSNKTNPKKFKVISFKDIVSLVVVMVLLGCTVSYSQAFSLSDITKLLNNAKNEATQLLNNAKNEANKIKQNAQTAANKLINEANNLKNQATQTLNNAKTQANKLISDAQSKANELISDANSTATKIKNEATQIWNDMEEKIDKILNGPKNPKKSPSITVAELLDFNKITDSNIFEENEYPLSNNLDDLKFYDGDKAIVFYDGEPKDFDPNYVLSEAGWRLTNKTRVTTITGASEEQFPMNVCTFVKEEEDNNNIHIVISYRQTESIAGWEDMLTKGINDAYKALTHGNWGTNIASIFLGMTGAEDDAKKYAQKVAEHYFKEYEGKNINIHVTGYSLGGYLAQIGGATLLENEKYSDSVKMIGYFNGRGLSISNPFVALSGELKLLLSIAEEVNGGLKQIEKYLNISKIKEMFGMDISPAEIHELIVKYLGEDLDIGEIGDIIYNSYITLAKNKDIVTLYRIKGEWCSTVGAHAGNIREYYPNSTELIKKQKEGSADGLKAALHAFGLFFETIQERAGNRLYEYIDIYGVVGFYDYMYLVHQLESFDGWDLATERREVGIDASFSDIPYKLEKNEKKTITLAIKISNGELKEELIAEDFTTSKNLEIKDISISEVPTATDYGKSIGKEKTYVITVKVEATQKVIAPTITLKADAFKIEPSEDFKLLNVRNDQKTGGFINSKNMDT